MEKFYGVLGTVLPVLLMLALGVAARRTGLLSAEQTAGLKKLVLNITLPAVLFSSFARAEYSLGTLLWPALMFLFCLAAMALGRAGAGPLKIHTRLAPFLTSGYEAGMLGYALFALLAGEAHVASFAIIDLGQVLFVFTVYRASLDRMQGGPRPAGEIVRSLLFSPMILAILAGVLMGATGAFKALESAGAGGVVSAAASFVAQPTGAVILLAVGYDLALRKVNWRNTLRIAGLRLAVSGVLMLAMLAVSRLLMHGDAHMQTAILLMFLLPPPYVLPIFASDPADRADISSALSLLTLVTVTAFALMAFVRG